MVDAGKHGGDCVVVRLRREIGARDEKTAVDVIIRRFHEERSFHPAVRLRLHADTIPFRMMASGTAHLSESDKKLAGAHYTPPELAAFLARATLRPLTAPQSGTVRVLDPACGDGSLLVALAEAAPSAIRNRLELVGFETDAVAIARAEENLSQFGGIRSHIHQGDFLEAVSDHHDSSESLFSEPQPADSLYDVIISNPPYVRTQVLGAQRAQELAKRFRLTGRVDLYHAFVTAMMSVLKDSGILGLLTSNRFMLIQSGAAVRGLFGSQFDLHEVFDLGDTKLFEAAVLPAIVIAERKRSGVCKSDCAFVRVYELRNGSTEDARVEQAPTALTAIESGKAGDIKTQAGSFRIDRGTLVVPRNPTLPWSLMSESTRQRIESVHKRRGATFDEVSRIRVGIKTTADNVFLRDDWDFMPDSERPEPALLHPLITHHVAQRWSVRDAPTRHVLYPHEADSDGRKRAVDLKQYPKALQYLIGHREQLEARTYVLQAGRAWYEIWVPQHPSDWHKPKVVFPDIAESGQFFLDETGAVVNGDCYWITMRDGRDPVWLLMMLAVGNSSFIQWYYDALFHNKLYAGRRRFMTQYVKEFPLPALDSDSAKAILGLVPRMREHPDDQALQSSIDALVWKAFGIDPIKSAGGGHDAG